MKNTHSGRIDFSFYNEHGHLVELNVFHFSTCVLVKARIRENKLELVGAGRHCKYRKLAIKEAIQNLYQQAYRVIKRA